jgi:hypothetical protein
VVLGQQARLVADVGTEGYCGPWQARGDPGGAHNNITYRGGLGAQSQEQAPEPRMVQGVDLALGYARQKLVSQIVSARATAKREKPLNSTPLRPLFTRTELLSEYSVST